MEFERLDQQVILLTPKWSVTQERPDDCICHVSGAEGKFTCTLICPVYGELGGAVIEMSFPVKVGEMEVVREGYGYKIIAYGMSKIGPGTWKIAPRIEQAPFHAHVVLCDVPEPAPWEM